MSDRARAGMAVVAVVGLAAGVAASAVFWQIVSAPQATGSPAAEFAVLLGRWLSGIVRHALAWL